MDRLKRERQREKERERERAKEGGGGGGKGEERKEGANVRIQWSMRVRKVATRLSSRSAAHRERSEVSWTAVPLAAAASNFSADPSNRLPEIDTSIERRLTRT